MKHVLVDTSFIVSILDRSQAHHKKCVEALKNMSGLLVSCEAVIAEACYLLRRVKGAPEAVLENIEQGIMQIPFDLSLHTSRAKTLMRKYGDVPMDLADACLVCLADEFDTAKILTLDKDFQIFRWRGKREFDLPLLK